MALGIGDVIDGKYRIVRLIGEGGMGAVFEGENVLINRRVAIKVLHSGMASDENTVERFQREARAAGRIGNDHILEVLDLGRLSDGDHYMVLEFLDGEEFSTRMKRMGRIDPPDLAPLIVQTLAGLKAAHAAGIIHRDLKPDNLFILKEKAGLKDFVKIIDFGISKFSPLSGENMRKTTTGAVMGTPYYMSPEQAKGRTDIDARSDLYAIGVIMYEAVTGQVPFDGNTVNELMFKIALSEPKPMRELVPELDSAFETIILRAMAREREVRFQSAEEFEGAVRQWLVNGLGVELATARTDPPPADKKRKTGSTWETDEPVKPPTSSSGLVVATLVGLAILLGGGFAAYKALAGGPATATVPVPSATATEATAPPPPKSEPAVQPAVPSAVPEPKPVETAAPPVAALPKRVPGRLPEPKPLPGKPAPTKTETKKSGSPLDVGAFGY